MSLVYSQLITACFHVQTVGSLANFFHSGENYEENVFWGKNGHVAYCLGKQLLLVAQLLNSIKQIYCVWCIK